MARKGKAPGGQGPMTYHEKKKKLAPYGTKTSRLGTDSQTRFGYCHLGLSPAVEPVATPSGHVYSREAIVSYLLQQTKQLKQKHANKKAKQEARERKEDRCKADSSIQSQSNFLDKDQGTVQKPLTSHASSYEKKLDSKVSLETAEEGKKILSRTSFWLTEFTPGHDSDEEGGSSSCASSVPQRPRSPMSGDPLRLKDLAPMELKMEGGTGEQEPGGGEDVRYVCAVSGKTITTQPVVLIKKSRQVMLEDVFEQLVASEAKTEKQSKKRPREDDEGKATPASRTMVCPVTGIKFKDKDVLYLQKAASGFAASGKVEAKKWTPVLM